MDINYIKKLMELLNESNLSAMEIQQGEFKIRLEKNTNELANQNPFNKRLSILGEEKEMATALDEESKELENEKKVVSNKKDIDEDYKVLKAPMVGAYHNLPDTEIKPGMKLKKGDKVCIIEAMKLMNEITMEEDGEIVSIEVNEGEMVEYGQVLLKYKSLEDKNVK